MSRDFYQQEILPFAGIIIKICRAYTDTESDFEDYYQEVCLQIWRSREKFKGNSEWSTFVYRITLNVCLTLNRQDKKKKVEGSLPDDLNIETSNSAFQNEEVQMLYGAIKQLREVDRVLILLYLEEKSYAEIGEVLNLKANNVGVRVKRIKKRLKKIIDGKVN
ncbi:RNA polymerase sigma factor [Mangrovivirga cuniculi]|uniref:RNA polymerase n=1 Tax=Mangrovivirga cuniculi TaxID=2715131 RepID=A0A4D7JM03_9BACT|nr:sigma-70 family RNA polymerase sigma factor [Mangrovivirga cuniculi]QCK16611.1 RNA polymerase [Mangrovivirga cuniculi]